MELKDRIRVAREARKLNQRELAEQADLSLSVVALLERGRRTNLKLSTAQALADALGCSVEWLAFGVGAAPDGVAA